MTHALKEKISATADNARDSIQEHGGHALDAIHKQGGKAVDASVKGAKKAYKAVGGLAASAKEGASNLQKSYVKKKDEAASAQSAFAKLAPALEMILPSEGSMCTFDVEFTIPVGKGVGFVGLHVVGTAARGTYVAGSGAALSGSSFQVGLYAAVTGGADVQMGKVKVEAGAYLATQGPTAANALDIASWTLYRNLLAESSVIPKEIVNAMYGKKGQTADEWDEETQEKYFTEEGEGYDPTNSGAVGLSLGASADLGKGPVKGAVGVKAKAGRVYDAKSIERREGADSSTRKLVNKAAASNVPGISQVGSKIAQTNRGPQASLGDRALTFVGNASIEVTGAGSAGVIVTAVLRQIKDKRGPEETSKWILASLMVDATVKSPILDPIASLASGGASIVSIIKKMLKASKDATDKVKEKMAEKKGQKVGKALESINNFSDGLGTALSAASGMKLPVTIPGLTSSGAIHLAGGMQARQMNLYIGFEKATSVKFDASVVAAGFEKIERVGSIEYDGSSWVVHFGDLEKAVFQAEKASKGNTGSTAEQRSTQFRKPLPKPPIKKPLPPLPGVAVGSRT